MTIHPVVAEMRRVRQYRGLSQDDLAGLSGVSATAIGTWERGTNAPAIDRLEQVLNVLGLRLAVAPAGGWLIAVDLAADGKPAYASLIQVAAGRRGRPPHPVADHPVGFDAVPGADGEGGSR